MSKINIKDIHSYWEKQALMFGDKSDVSWKDINMMNLEIKNIKEYIKDGDTVLDAGCSNGFSTARICQGKKVKITAIDYSPKSIKVAKKIQKTDPLYKNINFCMGDVNKINEKPETFDKVYSIRVIINIPDWELQKRCIREIHRVLKKGGLYLLSEAFEGSLKKLNALRKTAGMSPLAAPVFNNYLREEKFDRFIKKYFEIIEIKRFSSIYYVGSRFFRYLTMKKGEKDSFVNEINNYFLNFEETENSGDFGIQKLYILKK